MAKFPLLLEPEALAMQLPVAADSNVLIVEQASHEQFLQHHIPGSVHLDFKRLQSGQAPTPGALPDIEQLSAVLSELGLTPSTHVICSDGEGGGWAGRLIWALDCLGHTHYSYLNGGLTAWMQANLPTEQGPSHPIASDYRADLSHSEHHAIGKEALLAALGEPALAIWDARSALEYCGDKAISARGGHIPGAVNYDWTLAMDSDNGLRLRPLADIQQELEQLGLNAEQQIVTHCQTHHRSGLTYLIGKLLGWQMKAYPGSWAEWGNDSNTPVTTGQHP
ncbi:sulfurtransferase [Bacterioplanes sanyensis]|uniref:sulfurtransferase n=1 Tax=Bacterioplanes sanyensis TaxID=1249553 RepID=UPI001673B602|nr:rhodanese-like domain-containing protein [Bacterioplanes sanyensis]GGY46494.1 sulfurtransferase [Bacterioplanes sanyensis]